MDDLNVSQQPASTTQIDTLKLRTQKPKRTAADWVRDMRMSASVNKTTTGVETERVTPDLLLATSKKLLGISRRQQEADPKDSLEFQRFYGPAEYFAQHILRDGGKLGRNLLWKATNKGNLDFMTSGALDTHVSDVFYDSKLAQMIDGSSPLETVDAAYKTTRIGQGGVQDMDSAPDEMRTVQPSYFGYLDPVRCYAQGTQLMTQAGWKNVSDITYQDKLACLIDGRLEFHTPTGLNSYEYNGKMYGYKGTHISYLVTPNHRMYSRCYGRNRDGSQCAYNIRTAQSIHGTNRIVASATHQPVLQQQDQQYFQLPTVKPNLKKPQVHGNPPMGANIKNVQKIDIVDFAEFMGWYLSEGSYYKNQKKGYYSVAIAQDPVTHKENYQHIRQLISRLPFNAQNKPADKAVGHSLFIHRKQLCAYVEQFGHSFDKYIPDWIFTAPLKARRVFVRAMLQGDGRNQRHLCTVSRRLAQDFAKLQFQLGESVKIYKEQEKHYENHPGMWVVYNHTRQQRLLAGKTHRHKEGQYFIQDYSGRVYCPTVPGGLVYCRRGEQSVGFWCGNSPERKRVGLDMFMTKHCMKGSDGKLYQKFINAHTGKEQLVDSVTAAKSVVACPQMMEAKTKSIFALGGPTGVRIVPRNSVDYILPRSDDAYSMASNMVTMPSAVKEMRLLMGCLHPLTSVLTVDKKNQLAMRYAKDVDADNQRIPGADNAGTSICYPIRNTIAKFPRQKKWFKKVVLKSGRTLITSYDHKWSVLDEDNNVLLVKAQDLKPGDRVLRSTFKDVPNRRTFINKALVNRDVAVLLGLACRSMTQPQQDKLRIVYFSHQKDTLKRALEKLNITDYYFYANVGQACLGIKDMHFIQWLRQNVGATEDTRQVPSVILSACADVAAAFLDAYTADKTLVGIDSNQDIWVLQIPNLLMRDSLAFLFSRIGTDTLYRDALLKAGTSLALKLTEMAPSFGDAIVDSVKHVLQGPRVPIMIDIDINDNLYACGNGVITHNSKYPLQAVSLQNRQTPLVRGLDQATGQDMATLAGKYLGARFAKQGGVVSAVRKDRIDVIYDDGSKGSVALYQNFPMNAKGYIHNTPVVKAGQSFKSGDVLASSNYTDDKGTAAIGTNLRSGWLSWKGGTYEDAAVLSQSAAKKLTSTTMYKTAVDLDKTVSLGKNNYISWKPDQYTNDQMKQLDDNGIIKPGSVLKKGDPMILAVQTSQPSPGTMGKRVLTDLSQTWQHDHPGVVTDVVKTRKGVKVFATVTAPAQLGDKIAGCFDDKTEIFTKRGFVRFVDLLDTDEVAVLNEDGHASWEVPNDYFDFPVDMDIAVYQDECTDFAVTYNHKMLCCYEQPKSAQRRESCTSVKETIASDCFKSMKLVQMQNIGDNAFRIPRAPTWFTGYKAVWFAPNDIDLDGKTQQEVKELQRQYILKGFFCYIKDNKLVFSSDILTECNKDTKICSQHYEGHVYCVSTKAGKILVQRNGKPMWCGNCHGNKCVISQILPDDQMPVDKKGNALDVLWSPLGLISRCYDSQTQFLTRDGWKFGRDVLDTDQLYCYDTVTNNCSFMQQQAPFHRASYSGIMYSAHNRLADFRVTKHHKVWALLKAARTPQQFFVQQLQGKDAVLPRLLCSTDTQADTVFVSRQDWGHQQVTDQQVYCPTVPTGYVVTRRNGRTICMGNTNQSQIYEALLGKVAHKTGVPQVVPAFYKGDLYQYVSDRLKQNNVDPDDDLYDPQTGNVIPKILTGYTYVHKLKHLAQSKMSARGTDQYTSQGLPGGKGMTGSKRFGGLQQTAMVGHNAFDVILDAKLLRGQSNADFWRSIRTGGIPTIPGQPLVHRKFFAHLIGSGVNVRKTQKGISCFTLSNADVRQLAGPRQLKSRDTYEAKTFRPIDGGLFGQDIFGINGDKWAYIQLDEPMPNPVMQQPLSRLLRIPQKDFVAVASGKAQVNGMKSASDIKERLQKINLDAQSQQALKQFKEATISKKDAALKRYVAIERMRRAQVQPSQYMLDRIPVLPPIYRPVSSHQGLTMVADSNYLYAQLLDARDDMRDAKTLPAEYQQQARQNLYRGWKELTGLYDPQNVKLKNKHVQGLLKWALGNSPKFSALQRKVVGATVDTVGRGVVIPNPRLRLNELGIPKDMAFGIMAPFVERQLVKRGYTPVEAMKQVKQQTQQAQELLLETMKTHPVLMNRAPSLHKLNIMAFNPVLTTGHAIHVNPSIVVPFCMDFDGNCIDFDSEIYVKLSKSVLDKMTIMCYIISTEKSRSKANNERTSTMRIDKDEQVTTKLPENILEDGDNMYVRMKIGNFPRRGLAIKDRNGADVYEVPDGVEVLGCDPVTGNAGWYKVQHVTMEQNVHTVKVHCGQRSVIVSDNESLAVFDSKSGRLSKVKPEVNPDYLVPVLKKDATPFGHFGDRDLGWLFGEYISDGWWTDRGIGFSKQEAVKRKEFVRIMREYHENFTVREYSDFSMLSSSKLGDSVKVHLNSVSLADWWKQWKFLEDGARNDGDRTALYKVIDDSFIQQGTEDFLWGLLSGLLDGDGSFAVNTATGKPRYGCRFSTSSRFLKDSICLLLWRLGIRCSVTESAPRGFSNTAYTIMPSTVDMFQHLDKLTCVGDREQTLIAEWKTAAPAADKKDQIPLSDAEVAAINARINHVEHKDLYGALHRGTTRIRIPKCPRYILLKYKGILAESAPDALKRAEDVNTIWCPVDSIEDAGSRDVYDLEVADSKVYAVNNGFIVWDTANIHVPVSDNARAQARRKMFPQRNLIAMKNRQILYKPQKQYQQGLYIATRMKQGKDVRPRIFRSLQQARQAQRQGLLDVDDPIVIQDN